MQVRALSVLIGGKPMAERITLEKLSEVLKKLSKRENWERIDYQLFADEECEYQCFSIAIDHRNKDNNQIYFGPCGWCGDQLDDYAFDVTEISSVPMNESEKIITAIKSWLRRNVEEAEDFEKNGLYIERYCGWEELLK